MSDNVRPRAWSANWVTGLFIVSIFAAASASVLFRHGQSAIGWSVISIAFALCVFVLGRMPPCGRRNAGTLWVAMSIGFLVKDVLELKSANVGFWGSVLAFSLIALAVKIPLDLWLARRDRLRLAS